MKKIYHSEGEVIFHDPGPEMLRFFAEVDPSYRVQSIQPGPAFIPKFQLLREKNVKTSRPLFEMSKNELMSIFNGQTETKSGIEEGNWYSILDVLYVSSLKHIKECRLCGKDCGINRYRETGKCCLDSKAYHSNPFIHIAEEAIINPAIVTNFGGCGLRCLYCIEYENWNAISLPSSDPETFWKQVRNLMNQGIPFNTLEFTNPTESLPGLLSILNKSPVDFRLPVVLNTHLYGSEPFYEMANLIADVWLLDLRYGNDECANNISGVDNYMKYAISGLEAVIKQDAKFIVRILVLPGHLICCHKPAIELLSQFQDRIWVSILDQYVPEKEAHLDQCLKRRPTKEEISHVRKLIEISGLHIIESGHTNFWNA
jgi:putative pyruvate formate lyase activating enzyme